MRAVWVREFGGPEVLQPGTAPAPVPGAGQLLVEVAYAAIVFVDTQIRAGRSPFPTGPTPPYIPGNGVAGTVTAVGPGTDPSWLGRTVVTPTGGAGGYAELAVADAASALPVPDGLDPATAVALLADGRTAVGLHRLAAPTKGEWVLVEAAGGGVGSLLVQLAVASGARVIAAASSPAKLALASDLGAELTIDYSTPDWPADIHQATKAAPGGGVTVVYDGVGGEVGRAALGLIGDGGRFVVFGRASGSMTDTSGPEIAARGIKVSGLADFATLGDITELAAEALAEAAAGRLRPTIGQTFPLDRAADAHAAIESRTALGKTLLTVAG
jgi:NADPH2:quinone reductase